MNKINTILTEMIKYYTGDPKRIQHFIKVYNFAKFIGESENIDSQTQYILETAAVVHDIGIKASEKKYKSTAGKYQELEGPPLAEKLLTRLGYPKQDIERICWLVGHHHTYKNIHEIDYQILVEADFLVNAFEDSMSDKSIQNVCSKLFKTKTGTWLLKTMFLKKTALN